MRLEDDIDSGIYQSENQRLVQFVLNSQPTIDRFRAEPARREVVEMNGVSVLLVLASEVSKVLTPYERYVSDNGIKYVQVVRIGRGKGGCAAGGRPRLIMTVRPGEDELPLERWAKEALSEDSE